MAAEPQLVVTDSCGKGTATRGLEEAAYLPVTLEAESADHPDLDGPEHN